MKLNVLIDFSPNSENLLKYVADFNKSANFPVELIHRNSIHIPGTAESSSRDEILNSSNAEVKNRIQIKASQYFNKDNTQVRVSKEPLVNILNSSLAENPKQLTFFGLKGISLFKKLFVGSVAVKLVEKYNGILVGIPKNLNQFKVDHLYVGVSSKYSINTIEFNRLLDFYQRFITRVTFFTMVKNNDEDKNSLENTLSELANIFSSRVKSDYEIFETNDISKDVHHLIGDPDNSLLVLQRGSRLLNDQFFRNMFINELIYQNKLPLAILP